MRWSRIDTNNADCPIGRYGHSAVIVDVSQEWGSELIIVFGGIARANGGEVLLNDVCVLHVDQLAWIKPTIFSDTNPAPRAFHASVVVGNRMVIFGGQSSSDRNLFNDTWCLGVNDWEWKQLASDSHLKPPARSLSSMVSVGNNKIVLYGGRNTILKPLGDVWLLDVNQGLWTNVVTAGPVPSPRFKHAMVQSGGQIWMYGGESTTGVFLDDLWTLSDVDGYGNWQWHLVKTKPRPLARSGHSLTAHGNLLVSFGGNTAPPVYMFFSQSYYFSKELWILDLHSRRWIKGEGPDTTTVPTERACATMVTTSSKKLFLFGGRGKDELFNDSWWLHMDVSEPHSPASLSQSISSVTSSALHSARTPPNESSKSASAFLGSVLSSIPIPSKGAFSMKSKHSASTQSVKQLDNNEGHLNEDEVNTLYNYFNVSKEENSNWLKANEPDDQYLDLALISYGQHIHRTKQIELMTVLEARRSLSESDPKDFKLGNLWMLLADYKRLFFKKDVLEGLKEQNTGDRTNLEARFLHTTMDTLRLSDLPELLLDYRALVTGAI